MNLKVKDQRHYVLYERRGGMTGYIEFAGRYINLHRMAEVEGLTYGYLYRVIRGQRCPSIPYAERLAGYLGVSLEEFLKAIKQAAVAA